MNPSKALNKIRPPLQSIQFAVIECCDAFTVLTEMNDWVKNIRKMDVAQRKSLPITAETAVKLLGITLDQLCVRLQNLFDKRNDIDSLIKNNKGPEILELKNHPVVIKAIAARHNNIGHITRKYTPWPSIEEILNSNLKNLLESLKIRLITGL
jgi:hypothetical protein